MIAVKQVESGGNSVNCLQTIPAVPGTHAAVDIPPQAANNLSTDRKSVSHVAEDQNNTMF